MNHDTAALTAAAQQVVEDARRLGLVWTLQNATVTTSTPLTLQMDGDTVSIAAISMIGPIGPGLRVYVIQVPPGGNFVVGFVGNQNLSTVNNMFVAGGPTQTSATNVFTNILGPGSVNFNVTINKKFTQTALSITASGTFYSTVSGSAPLFAISVSGVTGSDTGSAGAALSTHWIGYLGVVNTSASGHATWAGSILLPNLGAGQATCQLQWQRNAGTGTLTMDVNDAAWMTVSEVWPS